MHSLAYEPHPTHLKATLRGSPTANEFLDALQQVGFESARGEFDLVLLDLREVVPVYSFTDQLRMGQEVARCMTHLRKLASVVPADRITRVSEKSAKHAGATVRIFTVESQALEWLLEGQGATAVAPA